MMNPTLWILSLFVSCPAFAEDVTLVCARWGGKDQTNFRVPREELETIPAWEPTDGKDAPLSRNQALEIARKAAAANALNLPNEAKLVISLEKTNPFEKELVERLPRRGCMWFYMVEFGGGDVSLKGKYTFLVTMSGVIASKEP